MAELSLVSQNPIINVPSPTKGFATFGSQQGVQNVATQTAASTNLAAETTAREQSAGGLAAEQATLQLRQQQLQSLRNQITTETADIQRLNGEKSSIQGQISAAQQQLQAAQARLAQIQAENERRRIAAMAVRAPVQQYTQPTVTATDQFGQTQQQRDQQSIAVAEATRIKDSSEFQALQSYYLNEYMPKVQAAEREAIARFQDWARQNNTTSAPPNAEEIRRQIGAKYGDPNLITSGGSISDPKYQKYRELHNIVASNIPGFGGRL